MTKLDGSVAPRGLDPDWPWGWATVAVQLALFAIPATIAWRSSLDRTVYVPMLALAATLLLGVALLPDRGWRGVGGRILAATLLELGLALVLVLAYSSANPTWDLS
ncbi:hypothetical protein [Nocardioides dilutus]